jgi:hypothetical protein
MRKVLFGLRLAFLLASILFAGASMFPMVSGASLDNAKIVAARCSQPYCGPQGPIWCGGTCRRPE